jgi:hypothetical protein
MMCATLMHQDKQKTVEVIRNGEQMVISSFDLVVCMFCVMFLMCRLVTFFNSHLVFFCLLMECWFGVVCSSIPSCTGPRI